MNSNQDLKFTNDESQQKNLQITINNTPSSDFCILSCHSHPDDILYKVGPRTYQLSNYDDTVNIFVLGCQGDGLEGQQKVADLMNDIAKKAKPAFVLVLGDNMYENGAASPDDILFKNLFDNVYLKKTNLKKIPFFLILGNHDGNYHKKSDTLKKNYLLNKVVGQVIQGKEVEKNQIIHTYKSDKYGSTSEKIERYQQDTLDLKTLQPWNLPHFFYSIMIGSTQIFCINSNSYPRDYLAMLSGDNDKNNQAYWLQAGIQQAKQNKKKIIIALHCPLYTEGKRAFPDDYDGYFYFSSDAEINLLNEYLGTNTKSYNELLKQIFLAQEITFDMVLAAHDHYLSYYNNKLDSNSKSPICQLKIGGGGGKLQSRVSAKQHPYVGCCLQQYGFATITFPATQVEKFIIDMYSVDGYHLRFDDQSHLPIRELKTDEKNDEIELLREQAMLACDEYLCMLKNEEWQQEEMDLNKKSTPGVISYLFHNAYYLMKQIRPYPPKIKEMAHADHLMAYFNQVNLPKLEIIIEDIIQLIDEKKLKDIFLYQKKFEDEKIIDVQFEHSFFYLLFKKITATKDIGETIKLRWQSIVDALLKPTAQISNY